LPAFKDVLLMSCEPDASLSGDSQ